MLLAAALAAGCDALSPPPPELPRDFVTSLPVITIAAEGTILDEPKTRARMRVFASGPGPDGERELLHDSYIGVELRGRSSLANFPKKQLGLEILTEGGVEVERGLLGMPAESDWVLHGPYADKTLLRNALTFEIARRMERYAPRGVFVELFLREDGLETETKTDYQGVYLLTEKISRGRDRIDLPRARGRRGEDTGYILKLDWEDPDVEETVFVTRSGVRVIVVYPRADSISADQRSYVERYVAGFEASLDARDYEDFIDVDAFVDGMLVQELANNIDAYRSSTFLHKTPRGKLHLGPLWDFNQAYGNASYNRSAAGTEGFRAERLESTHWMRRLLDDEPFRARLRDRYASLRQGPLSDASLLAWIDEEASRLEAAAARNFERWPVLGKVVLGNPDPPPATYREEIVWLKTWLIARTEWLDSAMVER